MSNEFKPGVTVKNAPSPENGAVSNAEEREFSEKETANQMRQHEEDFIQGLIDASGYTQEEHKIIEIARKGKVYFQFSIRPLSENEYEKCRKKNTKYALSTGTCLFMKLPFRKTAKSCGITRRSGMQCVTMVCRL